MDAFIGEIRLMAIDFTPQGWFPCDGRALSQQQYAPLFAIMGTTYGSSQAGMFNLPDLRGRVAPGVGDDPSDTFDPAFGANGGENAVVLTSAQVPSHTHDFVAATSLQAPRVATPTGNYLTGASYVNGTNIENAKAFVIPPPTTPPLTMNPSTIAPFTGGNTGHENRQPYLALQYFICWDGLFPVRP